MRIKIVFSVLLYLGTNQVINGQIIYVDVNNNTGIEKGTEEQPYNTIKEGILAASPGNQVMIRQGTYVPDDSWSGNPHTLLLKAGVSLIGEGSDKTIIAGIIVDQQNSNLSIGLENLKFDEFHFARGIHSGPFHGQNIIRNCKTTLINLPFGPGIPENDTTPGPNYGFRIENNDLGTEGSIEFKQGAGVAELMVTGNTCGYIQMKSGGGYTYLIDNNDVEYAINDNSASNKTTISNNRIHNGTIDDKSGGNLYGVEDEIIENNTITANENSPAFIDEDYKAGIKASSRSVTIRNNIITCTGKVSGIRSTAGAPMHIVNNTITLEEVLQPDADPYEGTIGIMNYSGWGFVNGNRIYGGNMGYFSKAGTVEFANNKIEKSYTGFYSKGAEVVHNNIIKNCSGDGMILDGLRGPLHHNDIRNNGGSGIRVMRNIDLGGGTDQSPGQNIIAGNGNYDLYIEATGNLAQMVFAQHNYWDHSDPEEILMYDIFDGHDSGGHLVVDFSDFRILGIDAVQNIFELVTFPNPLHEKVIIRWQTAVPGQAALRIYDLTGKMIKSLVDAELAAGEYQIVFDARGLKAGIYYCRFQLNKFFETRKLIIE